MSTHNIGFCDTDEAILMSTHNIVFFYEKMAKLSFNLSSNTHIISSSGGRQFDCGFLRSPWHRNRIESMFKLWKCLISFYVCFDNVVCVEVLSAVSVLCNFDPSIQWDKSTQTPLFNAKISLTEAPSFNAINKSSLNFTI